MTEAHRSGFLAEMVCSNSLGSEEITSASGLLKRELQTLDSFFLRHAEKARVPAGNSLSVDRLRLAADITAELAAMPGIRVIRGEVREIPAGDAPLIIASGPLTSPAFAQALSRPDPAQEPLSFSTPPARCCGPKASIFRNCSPLRAMKRERPIF